MNRLPDGVYHIGNVSTGAYAALLNNDDCSEVVNITFGLNDNPEPGSTVGTRTFLVDVDLQ